MLKQCTALVLLLAFLTTTFSKAFIVFDFYANRDYIARTLCVNRDKPMMHCGGRCQLCKRLNREADQDKKNPEQRAENRQELLMLDHFSVSAGTPALSCADIPYAYFPEKDPVDRSSAVFHPPAWSALSED